MNYLIQSAQKQEDYNELFSRLYKNKINQDKDLRDGEINTITKTVTFIITQACNLKCTYCYQVCKNSEGRMSLDTGKKVVDFLFSEWYRNDPKSYINQYNAQGLIMDFIGGEPLLEIQTIEKIYDYFMYRAVTEHHPWALHHMVSFSSNGLLYFDPKVQGFLTRHKERISLGITLDGNKELHDACRIDLNDQGSYDRVVKAVQHYKENYDPEYATKLTIAKENMAFLPAAFKHMVELGIKNINANCVYEEGWTNEHGRQFYYVLKEIADWILEKNLIDETHFSLFEEEESLGSPQSPTDNQNWCGGTGAMLAFDAKGDIYPCLRYHPYSLANKRDELFTVGHIDTGFAAKKSHVQVIEDLSVITRKSQSTDECFNCPISKGCGWCSAYNYDVFGTPNKRATYICPTHKGRVMANVYFWNIFYTKIGDPDKVFELHIPREWAKGIFLEEEWYELVELVADRKAIIEKNKKEKEGV